MTAAGPAIVSLRNVSKAYESGTLALSDFHLDVRAGEFVSLLGPSGCGKSTALRIVAGLSRASAGTVDAPDGGTGFVFQEPTLMPWASVADNVRLPLKLTHADEARSRAAVTQALERVGLAEFAQSYPRELSGGMKMRASIARALVTEPQLLLMDEPFAALDEINRFKLNNDLLRVWQELQRTVIFVTAGLTDSTFCDAASTSCTCGPLLPPGGASLLLYRAAPQNARARPTATLLRDARWNSSRRRRA